MPAPTRLVFRNRLCSSDGASGQRGTRPDRDGDAHPDDDLHPGPPFTHRRAGGRRRALARDPAPLPLGDAAGRRRRPQGGRDGRPARPHPGALAGGAGDRPRAARPRSSPTATSGASTRGMDVAWTFDRAAGRRRRRHSPRLLAALAARRRPRRRPHHRAALRRRTSPGRR